MPAAQCAMMMDAAMYSRNKAQEVKDLPRLVRECLSARLHLKCMESRLGIVIAARKAAGEPDEPDQTIEGLMKFARDFEKSKCTAALRAESQPLYDELLGRYVRGEEEE